MNSRNLISHIVVFWLKEDINNSIKDTIISNANRLNQIPGLQSFHIGKMLPSERDVVDNTYDFAFNMTFNSQKDLDFYINHKIHQEFVEKNIKPNIKQIKVYDFKI